MVRAARFGPLKHLLVASGLVLGAALLWPPPTAAQPGGQLQLDTPALPNTDVNAQPEFDYFAWNSFIALNWPALDPDAYNNQRGFPDRDSRFYKATGRTTFPKNLERYPSRAEIDDPDDPLTVWETLKEKREVFNFGLGGTKPPPWNSPPDYGRIRTGSGELEAPDVDACGGKLMPQLGKGHGFQGFDSLDETLEVASEALEPTLADGSRNPVFSRLVGPRVWRGEPKDNNPVRYEVRVNYDFYKYVIDNELYVVELKFGEFVNVNSQTKSRAGEITLPYRTSADFGPKGQVAFPPTHPIVVGYSPADAIAVYRKAQKDTSVLPPLTGAVHLKAAWIRLIEGQDDPSRYHTAVAQYFVTEGKEVVPKCALFGLIGLHIIQRVHTVGPYSTNNGTETGGAKTVADPRGGTFIFATFEHTDNDLPGRFTYSNFYEQMDDPNKENQPETGWYPPLDKPYTVKRKYPVLPGTERVNQDVHKQIQAANADSIWLNYRLVGTQFAAISGDDVPVRLADSIQPGQIDPNDPSQIGQPYFLANLVIETNEGLQHFHGLPPRKTPIAKYLGVGTKANDTVHYDHSLANVSFRRVPVNMGGCMGCHGVAQQLGYSFSFVLLGGYGGASVDTEQQFEIPGAQ